MIDGSWTSGVCAMCRAPVVVCGADDMENDYRWRCPNGHHDESTGDDQIPWWCLSPADERTEAEVVAAITRENKWRVDAKAAANAKDWERHAALVRERCAWKKESP